MSEKLEGEVSNPRAFGGKEEIQPEVNEAGEQIPTEEEQMNYDLLTVRARKIIFGSGKDKLLKMVGSSESPAQGLGTAASMLIKSLMDSAKQAGREIEPEVALEAATEVIEDLSELAKKNGVIEYDSEEDEVQELSDAMLWGVKAYGDGMIAAGEITPEVTEMAKKQVQEGLAEESAGKPNKVSAAVKGAINEPKQKMQPPGLVGGAMGGM